MSGKYDDIIHLPHPTSKKYPRMSVRDRAAIFSPFSALSGHGNAIYSPDMLVGRFHYRIDTLLPIDFTGKKGH